jgi:hypothetical protein
LEVPQKFTAYAVGAGERLGGAAVSVRKRYIQNEQVIMLIFVE